MLKVNTQTGRCLSQRKTPEGMLYNVVSQFQSQSKIRQPFRPKASLMVESDKGGLLFPDISTPDQIQTGVTAVEDSTAKQAEGTYTLEDGTVIKCEAGEVKEINRPAKVKARINRTEFQNSLK